MAYLLAGRIEHLAARQQDEVEARPGRALRLPEGLAQQALHAVAGRRASEPPWQHQAQAVPRAPVLACQQQEQRAVQAQPSTQQALEIGGRVEALPGAERRPAYAASRLRPF
jgi:hypothetical protein